MTIQEQIQYIKNLICGLDENGKSKSIAVVGCHRVDSSDITEQTKIITEEMTMNPNIEIHVTGAYTIIDMTFSEKAEFDKILKALETGLYATDEDSDKNRATSFLTLIPISIKGDYVMSAVLYPPMFAPELNPETNDLTKLRIWCASGDVRFYETQMDENVFDSLVKTVKGKNEGEQPAAAYDDYSGDDTDDFSDTELKFVETDDEDYT